VGQPKNEKLNKKVGSRIAGARRNAGFATSADFAAKCSIDGQTMRSIECGNVTVNAMTLRTFVEKLGVSADYLLGLSDVKTPDPNIRKVVKKYGLSEDALEVLASLNEEFLEVKEEVIDISKELDSCSNSEEDLKKYPQLYWFLDICGRAAVLEQEFSALNTILSDRDLAVDMLEFISDILDIVTVITERVPDIVTVRKDRDVSRKKSKLFNFFQKIKKRLT